MPKIWQYLTPSDYTPQALAWKIPFDFETAGTNAVIQVKATGEPHPSLVITADGIYMGDGQTPPLLTTIGGAAIKAVALTPQGSGTTSGTANTSTTAIPENWARIQYTLTNKSSTETIWVSKGGTAVVGQGIPVYPRTTLDDKTFVGNVNVVAAIASVPFAFSQT